MARLYKRTRGDKTASERTDDLATAKQTLDREALFRLANARVSHDFHAESRTHIVWVSWPAPFGTKGFGDFPDRAVADFQKSLRLRLKNSEPEELVSLKRALESASTEVRGPLSPLKKRQVAVRTLESTHADLVARAKAGETSLDVECTAAVRRGLEITDTKFQKFGSGLFDTSLQEGSPDSSRLKRWNFRLDPKAHAWVESLASETRTSVSWMASHCLLAGLEAITTAPSKSRLG